MKRTWMVYRDEKEQQIQGIRDESGFIVSFPQISKYEGQESRYRQECNIQKMRANLLVDCLDAFSMSYDSDFTFEVAITLKKTDIT